MNSTGRYIVRYEPSDSDHEYLQTTIEMSISDEASLDDMANFFDSFLKAATYVYDGSLKVVEDKPKQKTYKTSWGNSQDFWAEDGISLTGNPLYANDAIYTGAGVPGGMKDDVVVFG